MKEFIIRGKTASGEYTTINFSGHKGDYGFRLVEFVLYPSAGISTAGSNQELLGTVTAGKTPVVPTDPDFSNEGLIATAIATHYSSAGAPAAFRSVINDTFLITQDLILMVQDVDAIGPPHADVNWQVKFVPVKLSTTEAALTNYRQFSIFDE